MSGERERGEGGQRVGLFMFVLHLTRCGYGYEQFWKLSISEELFSSMMIPLSGCHLLHLRAPTPLLNWIQLTQLSF